jgi:hypothetical protein
MGRMLIVGAYVPISVHRSAHLQRKVLSDFPEHHISITIEGFHVEICHVMCHLRYFQVGPGETRFGWCLMPGEHSTHR